MATVKELIRELRKMPNALEVGVAMHDNNAIEIAGWVKEALVVIDTKNCGTECVVLRC